MTGSPRSGSVMIVGPLMTCPRVSGTICPTRASAWSLDRARRNVTWASGIGLVLGWLGLSGGGLAVALSLSGWRGASGHGGHDRDQRLGVRGQLVGGAVVVQPLDHPCEEVGGVLEVQRPGGLALVAFAEHGHAGVGLLAGELLLAVLA